MNEPRTSPQIDPARRLQLGRRTRRGVVASYIHELSERHNADRAHEANGKKADAAQAR